MKVEGVTSALSIFGPDLSGVQGRKVRTEPDWVETDAVQIARDFYKLNKFVTFVSDMIFVNGADFMNKTSSDIRLFTDEHMPYRTTVHLIHFFNSQDILPMSICCTGYFNGRGIRNVHK